MALDALNRIVIDVAVPGVMPVIGAVQEDIRSRYVEIELIENGEPLTIPAGTTGTIGIRRPNGTYVLYDRDEDNNAAVIIDGNIATCYLSQAALGAAGRMYANLVLHSGTVTLTAFAFLIDVQAAAVPSGAVPESYINILQNEYEYAAGVVEAAQEILTDCTEQADRAETEADRAETYANGNQYPVSYHTQTLSATEKEQARSNIGAASDAHAATHAAGGSDEITPASIGAAAASALSNYIPLTQKGAASGVATLNDLQKVTASQATAAYASLNNPNYDISVLNGYTLIAESGLTYNLGSAFPDGYECEMWNDGDSVVILNGTFFMEGEGSASTVKITSYGVAVLKFMNNIWYAAGSISL